MPSEFARKPRSLSYFDRFKAAEFRQILFYLGPVVFKGILNDEHYTHFLFLTIGITLLLDDDDEFYLKPGPLKPLRPHIAIIIAPVIFNTEME